MAWLYLPGTEASSSESTPPSEAVVPWVTLSGKAMQRPLSWRGWENRPYIRLLSGTTLPPSTAARGAESWISSLRASRANPSAWQERGEARPTSAGSGTTLSESFARFSHDGSLVKTSLDLFLLDSTPFCDPLPASGMMLSGELFELSRWEPLIDASGSSSSPSDGTAWTTPAASEVGSRSKKYAQGGLPLTMQGTNWATPNAGDAKAGQKSTNGRTLPREAEASSPQALQISTCGPECSPSHRRLNPAFVEWLMGLPSGWTIARTGSGPVATELYHYRQQLQSECSRIARAGS